MAEVLQKTLCGEIAIDQLQKWLADEERPDQNIFLTVSKGEFVPFFLNHIRQCTLWLFDVQIQTCGASDVKAEDLQPSGPEQKEPSKSGSNNFKDLSSTPLRNMQVNSPTFHRRKSMNFDPVSVNSDSYGKNRARRSRRVDLNTHQATNSKKEAAVPDLNDLCAFPPISVETSPNKVRRINPTPLARNEMAKKALHTAFSRSENRPPNSIFSPPYEENCKSDHVSERDLLKEARDRLSVRSIINSDTTSVINIKPVVKKILTKPAHQVVPHTSCISRKKELEIFIEIHSSLLSLGLVPNITSEVYFLLQLLTPGLSTEISSGDNAFNSVHNCVYFAIRVLEKQRSFIELLDNSTLCTLMKIPYLMQFSKSFTNFIERSVKKRKESPKIVASSIEEVAYREDIDTRKNFPTNECFSSFSKQRDMFYEIFEDWQQNCIKDVWCEGWFRKKVSQLLALSGDPMNFFYLARLIKSQILVSCLRGDDHGDKMGDLRGNFPERFDVLQDRISVQKGNPCPPPTFPGVQGFFEAFLRAADSASLNSNLQDVFIFEIVELNNAAMHFDIQNMSKGNVTSKFGLHLQTIQLLAKFLGFTTFMPYKSAKTYQESVAHSQKEYREVSLPPIDLMKILNEAIQTHQLVLTVPWLVEYLSMMDQVAPLVEHYIFLCQILIQIYRGSHKECLTNLNYQFLRVVIGWLLENPFFPIRQLYVTVENYVSSFASLDCSKDTLDHQDVVDKSLVYSFCPYLSELRSVLENVNKNIRHNAPEVRKITPLPTNALKNVYTAEQQLHKSLIENFYFLQPVNVKKIVEFSAERISSRFIYIIGKKIEKLKTKYVENVCKNVPVNEKTTDSKVVQSLIADNCSKLCVEARRFAFSFTRKKSLGEVKKLVSFLMAEEFTDSVVNLSYELATKSVHDIVSNWIETSLLPEAMKNDVRNKVHKLLKNNLVTTPSKKISMDFDLNLFPADILTEYKKLLSYFGSNCEKFSTKQFIDLCIKVKSAVEKGQLLDIVMQILSLTNEITISLIVHMPELCTREILLEIISLWSCCQPVFVRPSQILCPGYIYYFDKCSTGHCSWTKLGEFFDLLLENNLITIEQLRHCVCELDRDQWSDQLLNSFQDCLMPIVEKYCKRNNSTDFCDLFYLLQGRPLVGN